MRLVETMVQTAGVADDPSRHKDRRKMKVTEEFVPPTETAHLQFVDWVSGGARITWVIGDNEFELIPLNEVVNYEDTSGNLRP